MLVILYVVVLSSRRLTFVSQSDCTVVVMHIRGCLGPRVSVSLRRITSAWIRPGISTLCANNVIVNISPMEVHVPVGSLSV